MTVRLGAVNLTKLSFKPGDSSVIISSLGISNNVLKKIFLSAINDGLLITNLLSKFASCH